MIWLTAAIAFFALCSVVVGVCQWSAMSGQLREMKSGGVDTGILAIGSKYTSRAWINVAETTFFYTKDGHAQGEVVFTDTGPSPAFNASGWMCAQIRSAEPTIGDEMPVGTRCETLTGGTIGKGVMFGKYGYDPKVVGPNSLSTDNTQPGNHLYLWGRITYRTAFKDDGERFTKFCLVSGPPKMQMGTCPDGNDGN